jgi:hypothetical protein
LNIPKSKGSRFATESLAGAKARRDPALDRNESDKVGIAAEGRPAAAQKPFAPLLTRDFLRRSALSDRTGNEPAPLVLFGVAIIPIMAVLAWFAF